MEVHPLRPLRQRSDPPAGEAAADAGAVTPHALRRTLVLLSLAAFVSAAALRLCDSMLPALASSFGKTIGQAALVITAASVAYGCFQLLFGPLGDRYGKLHVIAWASLASTLGALGSAASGSFDALLVARALTGATTAALIPLSMAWIGDAVPFAQRQSILAKLMSGQIFGLVSGQALGGLFADLFGWRWAFAVLAASYFAVGLLLLRAVPRTAASAEAKAHTPMAERIRLVLRTPAAPALLVTVFFEAMMTFGVLAFAPSFVHQRFGISLFHAGAIVASFGLGGLLYTLFARRWVASLGPSRLPPTGGLLQGLAFTMLVLSPHWSVSVLACIVAGLGFYQFHNTLQTQATQLVATARGTAVSMFAACFFLGQASGAFVGASVVDHYGAGWLFATAALVLPLLGGLFGRRLARSASAGLSLPDAASPSAAVPERA
jgi:predicted MFS family arabinose efflux permease